MAIEVRRRPFRRWRLIGPALLVAIAGLHVAAYPDHVQVAPYLGVLFLLNAGAALALGLGILEGNRWSWAAATLFAAISLALYVTARTSGLPSYKEDDWVDFPFGLASVIVETAVLVAYAYLRIRQRRRRVTSRAPRRALPSAHGG